MDQVEEIKSKVDMVQLVGEYVKLVKAGRNFKGLCPFHGEKTPSFMVNPELQIYKCFGCNEGGDAYSFVQKMEGVEFGEALKLLAKRVGVTLVSYTPSKGEESREMLFRVNHLAADYYHFLLTKHKSGEAARKYLKNRKIDEKTWETFKLGFVPEGWDFLMKYLIGKKGFKTDELTRAGLVVDGRYDRFRNRIMFPLSNHRGQVTGFSGRVMPGGDEKAGKYINTPETEIYHKGDLLYGLDINKTEIKNSGTAVLVEGEIDAIASWQAGVKNVAAIKGSALTLRQVEILKRYAETAILALDSDLAGDMAARRGIEIAEKAGMIIRVLSAKSLGLSYKDPGEWATADPGNWVEAVGRAVPVYDYYIDSAVSRFGLDAVGKAKIGKELVPIWAKISDEITKGHYIKRLAEVLGVKEEDVRKQVNKISNTEYLNNEPAARSARKQIPNDQTAKLPTQNSRREVLEEYLVGLALRNARVDQLISLPAGEASLPVSKLFRTDFWKRVVEEICAKYEVLSAKAEVKDIIKTLPAELRERVEELMLVADELDEAEVEKEWKRTIADLEEAGIREQIEAISRDEGKLSEVGKLSARLNELTRDR